MSVGRQRPAVVVSRVQIGVRLIGEAAQVAGGAVQRKGVDDGEAN